MTKIIVEFDKNLLCKESIIFVVFLHGKEWGYCGTERGCGEDNFVEFCQSKRRFCMISLIMCRILLVQSLRLMIKELIGCKKPILWTLNLHIFLFFQDIY